MISRHPLMMCLNMLTISKPPLFLHEICLFLFQVQLVDLELHLMNTLNQLLLILTMLELKVVDLGDQLLAFLLFLVDFADEVLFLILEGLARRDMLVDLRLSSSQLLLESRALLDEIFGVFAELLLLQLGLLELSLHEFQLLIFG